MIAHGKKVDPWIKRIFFELPTDIVAGDPGCILMEIHPGRSMMIQKSALPSLYSIPSKEG
jgi:hypothetical protein